MKKVLTGLVALLFTTQALVAQGSPLRADDGVYMTPRATRPTVNVNKKAVYMDSKYRVKITDGTKDYGYLSPENKITVAVVQPFATAVLATPAVYSVTYWMPADVTSYDVQVGMRELLTPAGVAAAVPAMTIACGTPTADRQTYVGTPQTFTVTYPAYMVSDKVTCTRPATAGYVMVRYTQPAGTVYVEYVLNAGLEGVAKTIANSTNVLASSSWVDTAQPAGQVLLTYNTIAPRFVILSDSIMRGVSGTGQCGLFNSLVRLGPNRGYAVSVVGVASTTAATWAGNTNWMLGDTSPLAGATVGIALGTNDISAGTTATVIIRYWKSIIQMARAMGAARVILFTIPYSSTYSAPMNVERGLANAYARQKTGWYDDLVDSDTALGTAAGNFGTGGVHLTTAAFDILEPLVPDLFN